MKVSIIVPCYNQGIYVADCMNSIKSQTCNDWECILIDDGSTDDSASIIENLIDNDSRFRFIRQANAGVSAARNKAITHAAGEFILPLDADDKISPHYLENCLSAFHKEPSLKLVYGLVMRFGDNQEYLYLKPFTFTDLLCGNMIHCSGMYRKIDWEKIGGYDEDMLLGLEDWEFWINLLSDNGTVQRLEEIGLYYRIKKQSRNNTFTPEEFSKIKSYIGRKHFVVYERMMGDFPSALSKIKSLEKQNKFLKSSKRNALNVIFSMFRKSNS